MAGDIQYHSGFNHGNNWWEYWDQKGNNLDPGSKFEWKDLGLTNEEVKFEYQNDWSIGIESPMAEEEHPDQAKYFVVSAVIHCDDKVYWQYKLLLPGPMAAFMADVHKIVGLTYSCGIRYDNRTDAHNAALARSRELVAEYQKWKKGKKSSYTVGFTIPLEEETNDTPDA